jgi:hypothetical protein
MLLFLAAVMKITQISAEDERNGFVSGCLASGPS